jgi:flagellar protein FliO/FliZ
MVDASVFTLLLRLVVSLAVVIALMIFLAAALRKRGVVLGGPGGSGGTRRRPALVQVDVIARRALGRNAQVAVVRTAGRTLVLGVTDHQVTMLLDTEIDDADADGLEVLSEGAQGTGYPGAGPRSGSAWKAMLDAVRERTVRR